VVVAAAARPAEIWGPGPSLRAATAAATLALKSSKENQAAVIRHVITSDIYLISNAKRLT
jgi:hypothetical protein